MSDFKCPMCTDCPHNCPLEDRDIDTRIGSADWKVGYSQGRVDVIEELVEDIINKINFEEKWLLICKSNNADTRIAFSALRSFVKNLRCD